MKFEIKKEEYVNKTFRLPKELAERLAAVASECNVSANEFTIQAIEFAIANMTTEEK
jgi:predicted HicB family RNase H-like nuclease